jgi:hypothetical protein
MEGSIFLTFQKRPGYSASVIWSMRTTSLKSSQVPGDAEKIFVANDRAWPQGALDLDGLPAMDSYDH